MRHYRKSAVAASATVLSPHVSFSAEAAAMSLRPRRKRLARVMCDNRKCHRMCDDHKGHRTLPPAMSIMGHNGPCTLMGRGASKII